MLFIKQIIFRSPKDRTSWALFLIVANYLCQQSKALQKLAWCASNQANVCAGSKKLTQEPHK
jgi:hypothetical protein